MLPIEFKSILIFLASFFLAISVLPKLVHIAKKIGLVDHPTQRKIHTNPCPLVGGIGMVISATFAALLFVPLTGLRGFFSGLALLLLVGFLDDFKELGHKEKFLAQIAASLLLIYFSNVVLLSFGDLLGLGDLVIPYTWLAWMLTVFCVVGVINAVNLIDGLDGLAGGITFVAFMTFCAHASFAGNTIFFLLNLAFAGAVLGFLRFNWHPAKLFMGDAGSLCLGFTLTFMAVSMSQGPEPIIKPVTALLILALPIIDTLTLMSQRIFHGKNPFKADRHHIHHIFIRYGMSRQLSVKVIVGISAILAGVSIMGSFYDWPEYALFALFMTFFALYFGSSFFILTIARYSLKVKRKREYCGLPSNVLRFGFTSIDRLRVFRKYPRYPVELPVKCYDRRQKASFDGTIRNISKQGCMASIPGLQSPRDRMSLTLSLTSPAGETKTLELIAGHRWFTAADGSYNHGFQLEPLDEEQEIVWNELLAQAKLKKS
jgi:UDP-GlcNAc:undecaprenyl-phosphate/decaprenyl-phosphate GlcNAc-1-phosphate transferase